MIAQRIFEKFGYCQSPFTNKDIYQSFTYFKGGRIPIGIEGHNFGDILYTYVEGNLRQCKVLSIHFVKNGSNDIRYYLRGYVAGYKNIRVWEYSNYCESGNLFSSEEEYKDIRKTSSCSIIYGKVKLSTKWLSLNDYFNFKNGNNMFLYKWENGLCVEHTISIHSIWCDANDVYVNFNTNGVPHTKLYRNRGECEVANMNKAICFDDVEEENKPSKAVMSIAVKLDLSEISNQVNEIKDILRSNGIEVI